MSTEMNMSETHPVYWSVRRELWENRSTYIVPLAIAAFVLFVVLITMAGLPKRVRNLPADPAQRHAVLTRPFRMAPAVIMGFTVLVGLFYSIDALYSERRDRSILFWKSLPVSDRTTVLSKASIPMVVLPLFALALSLATQAVILFASTIVLLASGTSPAPLWGELRFFQQPLVMIYGLTVHALWLAPLHGWLILLSAWAKRAPILWAVVPPLALSAFERMAFNTSHFPSAVKAWFLGPMGRAFVPESRGIIDRLEQLTPARFLATPGLWIGLIVAALFLTAAVRLRRNREPI